MNDRYKDFVVKGADLVSGNIPNLEYGLVVFNKEYARLIVEDIINEVEKLEDNCNKSISQHLKQYYGIL